MELHHDKHHAAYVKGLNAAELALAEARERPRQSPDLLEQHAAPQRGPGRAQFQAAALRVEGNGWGALVYAPGLGRLYTLAFRNHQNCQLSGAVPLLLCDVWEHAYYLKYQNRRGDYLTAWWNVVDWANVEERFAAAR